MSIVRSAAVTALGLALSLPVAAANIGLSHASARSLGQGGALVARADEPAALRFNPAAAAKLPGLQVQTGLSLALQRDSYESPSGSWRTSSTQLEVPSLSATWRLPGAGSPLALAIGMTPAVEHRIAWQSPTFAGRFLRRAERVRVVEAPFVVAWEIDPRWSFGAGPRYLRGRTARTELVPIFQDGAGTPLAAEVTRFAEADVDGWAFDLGILFADVVWGWGAAARSGVTLDGTGSALARTRQVVPPAGSGSPAREAARASLAFELPWEVAGGIWLAPYPELRIELAASLQAWSEIEATRATFTPDTVGDGPEVVTPRDWKDTVSLRLGVEGDLNEDWILFGGVALEPSPAPSATLEPGFPRGDAVAYSLGAGYSGRNWSADAAIARFSFTSRSAAGQEVLAPDVEGRYRARQHRLALSFRWHVR